MEINPFGFTLHKINFNTYLMIRTEVQERNISEVNLFQNYFSIFLSPYKILIIGHPAGLGTPVACMVPAASPHGVRTQVV